MNSPKFINISEEKSIDPSVFKDLCIDRFLAPSVISIIKHPCDEVEIKRRHLIFKALKNEAFCVSLNDLLIKIKDYEKAKTLLSDAATKIEKLHLQVNILECYLLIHKEMSELSGYCPVTDQIAEYWCSEEKQKLMCDLSDKIDRIRHIQEGISSCRISIAASNHVYKPEDTNSYYDNICRCVRALSLSVPKRSGTRIKPDDMFSDSFFSVFSKEVFEMENYLNEYSDLLALDFSDEGKAITFFFDMKEFLSSTEKLHIPNVFPETSSQKIIRIDNAFDISLCSMNESKIIPNNVRYSEREPFYFLLGANGGGKTTYIRAIGINIILFLAGCPIFADHAEIYPFENIMTHFPCDESALNTGRLEDEKQRVEYMLRTANSQTILLFNETFSSTNEDLGCELAIDLATRIKNRSVFGLFVTHFHKVLEYDFDFLQTEVIDNSEENTRSTYRIVRQKQQIGSYANTILQKYSLDYNSLYERRSRIND